MQIGDIIWKRHGGEWVVVTIPNEAGWFLAKGIEGLVMECHVSDFLIF